MRSRRSRASCFPAPSCRGFRCAATGASPWRPLLTVLPIVAVADALLVDDFSVGQVAVAVLVEPDPHEDSAFRAAFARRFLSEVDDRRTAVLSILAGRPLLALWPLWPLGAWRTLRSRRPLASQQRGDD